MINPFTARTHGGAFSTINNNVESTILTTKMVSQMIISIFLALGIQVIKNYAKPWLMALNHMTSSTNLLKNIYLNQGSYGM